MNVLESIEKLEEDFKKSIYYCYFQVLIHLLQEKKLLCINNNDELVYNIGLAAFTYAVDEEIKRSKDKYEKK